MASAFDDYIKHIHHLRFQSAHFDFQLISKEQQNISVFIPLNIPVEVASFAGKEAVFSTNELSFLKQHCITPNQNQKIEGEKVFDLYLHLIDFKGDFITKKVGDKILQGIMSKFTISMIGNDKVKQKLVYFSDQEKSDKGYIYLRDYLKVYDENFGINDQAFETIETQFL